MFVDRGIGGLNNELREACTRAEDAGVGCLKDERFSVKRAAI